jgi:hypothetical protein
MTGSVENEAERLVGWSIVGLSLLPERMLTLQFISFNQPMREGERNFAKVTFVGPTQVSIQGFRRQFRDAINITTSIRLFRGPSESVRFELDSSQGGRAVIDARDISIVFY